MKYNITLFPKCKLGKFSISGLNFFLFSFVILFCQTYLSAQVSMVIGSGDMLAVNGNMTITLSGNWQNNGVFVPGSGTVSFEGSGNQAIANAGGETFNNLAVNNSGGVTLSNSATVQDTLALISGKLNTSASNSLTLVSSAGVSGGSSSSFVNGPMAHNYASASSVSKTYPIGKETTYRPISLTITHDAATETQYIAEVFNQAPASLSYIHNLCFIKILII